MCAPHRIYRSSSLPSPEPPETLGHMCFARYLISVNRVVDTVVLVWAKKKEAKRERESLDTLGRDAQAINHLPLNDCVSDETCESAAAF